VNTVAPSAAHGSTSATPISFRTTMTMTHLGFTNARRRHFSQAWETQPVDFSNH
jgi:hypothetical protein